MTADRASNLLKKHSECSALRKLVLGDDIAQAMSDFQNADTPITLREAQAAIRAVDATNAERILTSFV